MSNVSSPTRFSGVEDHFFDRLNITEKMRVPKTIKVSGDHDNIESLPKPGPWDDEKFDMKVPDRILVVGQDQYYGTTAPPRELVLENSVMPPDPGMIRVQTPPRVITVNERYFTSAEDEEGEEEEDIQKYFTKPIDDLKSGDKKQYISKAVVPSDQWSSVSQLNGAGDDIRKLALCGELAHLRMQMARLNRRLLALEFDNNQRQQRDKTIIALGLGYVLIKFLLWINK